MSLFHKNSLWAVLARPCAERNGITAIEMVVSLAIITLVSAQVLVSFTGLNEGVALRRSAQELALAVRRAQNMALGARQFPDIPQNVIAAGIRLSNATVPDSAKFFLFTDLRDTAGVRNNRYDQSLVTNSGTFDEKINASEEIFPRGVRISCMCTSSGCSSLSSCPNSVQVAHAVFASPEASAVITDVLGNQIGNRIEITLRAPTAQTIRIIVLTTGQITVK